MKTRNTILVVDDEPDIRAMMNDILSDAGYSVLVVESGEDALVLLEREHEIDLILLDVSMPGLSGLDVLDIIRNNPATSFIPVIMVTALDQIAYKKRAYALGVNDFLAKPFEVEELLLRTATHLRLSESIRNERQLNEKLLSVNEELKNFAYAVSHDLKTPLRGIASLAEWIEEDLRDCQTPEVVDNLHLLKKRVSRLNNMIEETLQYSRIGRISEQKEDVDTGVLVDEIIEQLGPPPRLHVSRKGTFPVISINRTGLARVFSHLIGNAIVYHNKPDGIVEITSSIQGNQYCFEIRDDGPGINPLFFKKIFQIFHSLSRSQGEEHIGVGLSIAKKIVETNGGVIRVKSEQGKGSSFMFTIPRSQPTEESRSGRE